MRLHFSKFADPQNKVTKGNKKVRILDILPRQIQTTRQNPFKKLHYAKTFLDTPKHQKLDLQHVFAANDFSLTDFFPAHPNTNNYQGFSAHQRIFIHTEK